MTITTVEAMSEYSTRSHDAISEPPAHKGEDGSNSTKGESTTAPSPASPRQSIWAKVARILRPQNAASLREDLADVLATEEGAEIGFSPVERAMLKNILRFREVRVEDVMVPRAEIEAVDQDTTLGELMMMMNETGRSRMPVYSDTLDDPRGMVHIRDMLGYMIRESRNKRRTAQSKPAAIPLPDGAVAPRGRSKPFDLARVNADTTIAEAGLIRPVLFVPPSMLASELMVKMQAERIQMALVIDEYGGTDGLASLEDIVEMLVGDIEDEHDDEPETLVTQSEDGSWDADARAELDDVAKLIDVALGEIDEDVDTLGGLAFVLAGEVPAPGRVLDHDSGWQLEIVDGDERRVTRIRLVPPPQPVAAEA